LLHACDKINREMAAIDGIGREEAAVRELTYPD